MKTQQDDWTNEIGRMVALAERMASEGHMNLNKLIEAAIYSEVRRAGWRYRPEVSAATMQSELEATIRSLKQHNLAPELIDALENGRRSLSENPQAVLLFEEAPDMFVCRTCGHMSPGSPPAHCPDCGAWPGRFRKFVATFNGDNYEPLNPKEVLALLARNAADLARLVEDLSEEDMTRTPGASDWSIRDHVAHFYDTQDMLDARVELMLTHENPEVMALAVYEFATKAERHPPTTLAILAEFRTKRNKCVARLKALPFEDWWRTGRHTEFGLFTILRQAAYLAFHEQTHLPEIEALRKQVVGDS